MITENPSTIIGVQETHFNENDAKGMEIMAKFASHNSTYNGDGNRQKPFMCWGYSK